MPEGPPECVGRDRKAATHLGTKRYDEHEAGPTYRLKRMAYANAHSHMAFHSAPRALSCEAIADLAAIFALLARRGRDLLIACNSKAKKGARRSRGVSGAWMGTSKSPHLQ